MDKLDTCWWDLREGDAHGVSIAFSRRALPQRAGARVCAASTSPDDIATAMEEALGVTSRSGDTTDVEVLLVSAGEPVALHSARLAGVGALLLERAAQVLS